MMQKYVPFLENRRKMPGKIPVSFITRRRAVNFFTPYLSYLACERNPHGILGGGKYDLGRHGFSNAACLGGIFLPILGVADLAEAVFWWQRLRVTLVLRRWIWPWPRWRAFGGRWDLKWSVLWGGFSCQFWLCRIWGKLFFGGALAGGVAFAEADLAVAEVAGFWRQVGFGMVRLGGAFLANFGCGGSGGGG